MKIQWKKVTWYSKTLALALFVALPFIGFWFGIQTGQLIEFVKLGVNASKSQQASDAAYYQNVAEWQTDSRFDGGFSIAYPIDFEVDDNYSPASTTDWRLDANGAPGMKMLTITIPRTFEPQTNFADATLTIGKSGNPGAIANCMAADVGGAPNASTTTTIINGLQFYVFQSSDAGAGNYYQTTSYRTLHAGQCYAVEYTIHSNQIANYPPEYKLQPFDEQAVSSVLDRIVGTLQLG